MITSYIYSNKDKYIGEVSRNLRNGKGTYYWKNGFTLTCEWVDNLPHNILEIKNNNKLKYKCLWHKGNKIGNAKTFDVTEKEIAEYINEILNEKIIIEQKGNNYINQNKEIKFDKQISKDEKKLISYWQNIIFSKLFSFIENNKILSLIFFPIILFVFIFMPLWLIFWLGPVFMLWGIIEVFLPGFKNTFNNSVSEKNFYQIVWIIWTLFIGYIFWGEIIKNIISTF